MKISYVKTMIPCFLLILSISCNSKKSDSPAAPAKTGWEISKESQAPVHVLTNEFQPAVRQSNATLAWEDGIYITRDGLTLYAQYIQMDLFKGTVIDAKSNPNLYPYKRGPSIGQNLTAPGGITTEWMHSDLAYSTRTNVNENFPGWTLTAVNKSLFNDAAPQGIINAGDSSKFDIFLYTDEDTNPAHFAPKIRILRNVNRNPTGPGTLLLSAGVSADQFFDENPHVERFDVADPNKLVLFFDSKNRNASLDIFYTTSTDNGATWAAVQAVSTVNSTTTEHQPHLYFDGTTWWLYLSAVNSADSKLAIYRYRQGTVGNWNSWQNKELVVSAGTALGVGEPSLTTAGDLSFVVITENQIDATATDKYDADPWFMKKK